MYLEQPKSARTKKKRRRRGQRPGRYLHRRRVGRGGIGGEDGQSRSPLARRQAGRWFGRHRNRQRRREDLDLQKKAKQLVHFRGEI